MRDRRKRNIMIGSLCCLLVFMGIGYALLSQTLNINGTATMAGEWEIYIDSITVKEEHGSAKSTASQVSEDKLGASFDVELVKPGDYVEYDVVVKNDGTINAVLRELVPNIESNNMDILLTHSIIQGQILKAESETKFTLKIRFDERATEIVSGGKTSFDIRMVYEQYDGDASGIDPTLAPVTANDCFTIDNNGVITGYDYSCGTYVTIPAVVNGTTVTEISSSAFTEYNAKIYGDEELVVFVKDQNTYDLFYQFLIEQELTDEQIKQMLFFENDENAPDVTGLECIIVNATETDPIGSAYSNVEYLDLSQATELKKIGYSAFASNEAGVILKYFNVDQTKLENIEETALMFAKLDSLTITTDMLDLIRGKITATIDTLRIYPGKSTETPEYTFGSSNIITVNNLILEEGITKIANYTFSGNDNSGAFNVKNVELPESLIEIGNYSFYGIPATEITLPSKLKRIGEWAFAGSSLTSINIPDSVETIKKYAFYNSKLTKLKVSTALRVNVIENDAFSNNLISEFEYSDYEGMSNRFAWFVDVDTIGERAFANNKLQEIRTQNVKTIGVRAFQYNDTLTNVTINYGNVSDSYITETIGNYAFSNCGIKFLHLVNVKNIGNYAFEYNNLTNMDNIGWNTTADKIETIGEMIFFGNPTIYASGYWEMGCNIKSIGNSAFNGIENLSLRTKVKAVKYNGYEATKEGTQIGSGTLYYYYNTGSTCG